MEEQILHLILAIMARELKKKRRRGRDWREGTLAFIPFGRRRREGRAKRRLA